MRCIKPFASTQKVALSTHALADVQTKVTWTFDGSIPYPYNFILLFTSADKMIGDNLSEGLTQLKTILENHEPKTN